MIPISNFIEDTLRKMEKLEEGGCIDLRPYKKDRSVIIERHGGFYNVYEDGFHEEEFHGLSRTDVEKLLKVLRKREFPRSNVVWSSVLKTKDYKG